MLYSWYDAKNIAANEIWHSMRTLKGNPEGSFFDRRYLWFLGVL